ncbi:MAG: J domain-containing protein [Deltaproteobacteria bacterium]|nr:J domain-containing protein [Deltaproteobacteria bacterium]
MAEEDLYKILGVDRDTSETEIKKVYRKLARELHPDRNRNNKAAEERFKKVSAAYAVLSNKEKRKLYDEFGVDGLRDGFDAARWRECREWGARRPGAPWPGDGRQTCADEDLGGFSGFGSMEDIFESLFGGGRVRTGGARRSSPFGGYGDWPAENPGAQVKSVLEVELLDAVIGRELEIVVPMGHERRKLKVTLPQGVEDGQIIRLKGQGGRTGRGGPAGDLLLEIRIKPDPAYQRQGLDLVKRETVTVGQAYHGVVVKVETPWGQGKLTIPPGTQGGQKMRLKGQGVRRGAARGDLYVQIGIRVPTRQDEQTAAAVDKLESFYD